MLRLTELRNALNSATDRREQLRSELLELGEADEFGGEQRSVWDGKNVEFDAAEAECARLEGEVARAARIAESEPRARVQTVQQQRKVEGPYEVRLDQVHDRGQLRSLALKAVEEADLDDHYRGAVEHLVNRLDGSRGAISRHVLATGSPAYRSAFGKYISGAGHTLDDQERAAVIQARAMSLTDAAGGYGIPFTLDPTLIDTATHLGFEHPWRTISNVVQTTTDNWQGVAWNGISASMVAEATEATDGSPTVAQPAITVKKAQAFIPFSVEIDADWPQMEAEIRRGFAWAKMDLEDSQFSVGAGTGNNVNGVVTDVVTASTYVQTSATTDVFAAADVYATENKLVRRFAANGTFVANHAVYNLIRQFDTGGGAQLWTRIGDGQSSELMGRPAYESANMDGVINAGSHNYMLLFGDFKAGYTIVDRLGATVEYIPHLFGGTNNYPTGQRGLYFYWRFGAKVTNTTSIALLNVT